MLEHDWLRFSATTITSGIGVAAKVCLEKDSTDEVLEYELKVEDEGLESEVEGAVGDTDDGLVKDAEEGRDRGITIEVSKIRKSF